MRRHVVTAGIKTSFPRPLGDAIMRKRVQKGNGYVLIKYKNMPTGGASDQRLKEDVAPLMDALEKILKLQPVTWRWKNENNKDRQLGFIAQDVEKVLPELVSEGTWSDGESYKHLATGDILPYLVGAMHEQQVQIDKLRKELDRQKG